MSLRSTHICVVMLRSLYGHFFDQEQQVGGVWRPLFEMLILSAARVERKETLSWTCGNSVTSVEFQIQVFSETV